MMKHEFDSLVGLTTTQEAYNRIEYVYMNSDRFNTKQEIADFYKEKDMNGIEKIYQDIIAEKAKNEEFIKYIADLAVFSEDYIEEIKIHLSQIAIATFEDKTIVKLLHEYAIRKENERKKLFDDFLWNIRNNESEYGTCFGNNSLTNANHYKTVLYDILIDEWRKNKSS